MSRNVLVNLGVGEGTTRHPTNTTERRSAFG
jgi:hypothetical protein